MLTRRRMLQTGSFVAAYALFPEALHAESSFQPSWRQPVAFSQAILIASSTLYLHLGEGPLDLPHDSITSWVRRAAEAVVKYYGRFPVSSVRILVLPSSGGGVRSGATWGDIDGSPAFIRIRVGKHTTLQQLNEDWMMTHELIHTALPSLPDKNHWLEEGIAFYVEPIARVQSGQLDEHIAWADMINDMPQGNPGRGDRGLDHTPTWGRTYWGGAGFCLLADIELRKQSHNRIGLQQALRAIVNAGGTIDHDWPIERALDTADKATGTVVLTTFYKHMSNNPVAIDFNSLWSQLGVTLSGNNSVTFDAKAPLANIRQAIFSTTA